MNYLFGLNDAFVLFGWGFEHICGGFVVFAGLSQSLVGIWLNLHLLRSVHGHDLNLWVVVHGNTVKQLIRVNLALFKFLYLLNHIPLLLLSLLLHSLPLIEQLLPLKFNNLCLRHLILNFLKQLFLLILLNLHNPLNILLLINPLNNIIIMFLHHPGLPFPLNPNQILFLWLQLS